MCIRDSAEGREELALVEHPLQYCLQSRRSEQRQEMFFADVALNRAVGDPVPVKLALVMADQSGVEARHVRQQALVDDLDGEQRNQPDPRKDVDVPALPVGAHDEVLEELVLLVPQGQTRLAVTGDRVGDGHELLVALDRHVLVVVRLSSSSI